MKPSILLIEDDPGLAQSLSQLLTEENYQVVHAAHGDRILELLKQQRCDLVLTDLKLPGVDGLTLVKQICVIYPALPVILMTAHGTTETAIETTKSGAFDYLLKPFEIPDLLCVISNALRTANLFNASASPQVDSSLKGTLIGSSPVMQNMYKEIGRLAARRINVLIRGETGTGKELVARALHQYSNRSHRPFVAVNCAAIPENLIESELFGHEKGSFTGASQRYIGKFQQAHEGILFLDEIGDMDFQLQAKLLRVLQEGKVQPIGAKDTVSVDVRVIAATHRNLQEAIQSGHFREDLFYRLNAATIDIPPLRKRKSDIRLLMEHFLCQFTQEFAIPSFRVDPEGVDLLLKHAWPGNVRELENIIRRALALAPGGGITRELIRKLLFNESSSEKSEDVDQRAFSKIVSKHLQRALSNNTGDVLEHLRRMLESELCSQAFELTEGNQSKAARLLGISRFTLREKLTAYEIVPPASQETPKS